MQTPWNITLICKSITFYFLYYIVITTQPQRFTFSISRMCQAIHGDMRNKYEKLFFIQDYFLLIFYTWTYSSILLIQKQYYIYQCTKLYASLLKEYITIKLWRLLLYKPDASVRQSHTVHATYTHLHKHCENLITCFHQSPFASVLFVSGHVSEHYPEFRKSIIPGDLKSK